MTRWTTTPSVTHRSRRDSACRRWARGREHRPGRTSGMRKWGSSSSGPAAQPSAALHSAGRTWLGSIWCDTRRRPGPSAPVRRFGRRGSWRGGTPTGASVRAHSDTAVLVEGPPTWSQPAAPDGEHTDRAQHSAARPHRRPVAAEQRRPDGEGSATAEHEATAAPWDRWRTGRGRNRACTAQLRQAPGRRACRGGTWPHGSRGVHPLGGVAPRRTASLWRGAMPSSCSSAGPGGTRVDGPHPSVGTVGGGVIEHPVVKTTV